MIFVSFQVKVVSPKHRLIKVDSQEFGRCKVPLSPAAVQEEPVRTCFPFFSLLCPNFLVHAIRFLSHLR